MYLNIILTLLFLAIAYIGLTFSIILVIMRKEGHQERTQYLENKEYQKSINTKMVILHEEMLKEIKRRSHDRLML